VALTGTRQSVALGLKWKHVALGETLRNHSETASHRGPDDFVFCKKDGSPLGPDVFRKDALCPILDRLGIPRKKGASRFHTFRHSAASIANEESGNLKLAQKFLRHSTITMTADITRTLLRKRNVRLPSL
jgi:integrase